jgi:very-short-patch-repair endonuclease
MNFGPLNQEGGWRRLNVLITRARKRCVVFSSIRAEDFDLQTTQARGVQALRDYLEYALSRRLPSIQTGDGQFGSDFEHAVYNALVEQGLKLQCQVGCAGYAIDLAVIDPNAPGKYVLGIECDGAMYHSSACARDRDRLRQQVLEGLGWKIHRIWSTDWFRKPQTELERVLDAVHRASSGRWKPMLSESSRQPQLFDCGHEGDGEESPAAELSLAQPYERYERSVSSSAEDFYIGPIDDITDVLIEIVQCEGPIHQEVAFRRAARAWGLSRVGSKIEERAKRAMKLCQKRGDVELRDGFLWPKGMNEPPVRRRDEDELRDIDMISVEEIGQGACLLLASQLGMSRQDLITQTAHLLGFANTGARIGERVDQAIQGQIDGGAINEDSSGMLGTT